MVPANIISFPPSHRSQAQHSVDTQCRHCLHLSNRRSAPIFFNCTTLDSNVVRWQSALDAAALTAGVNGAGSVLHCYWHTTLGCAQDWLRLPQ